MKWFKEHSDTISIIGAIVLSIIWINSEFKEVRRDLSTIDKDIAIIKTVLVMKNILPNDYAINQEAEEISK